MMPEHSPCQSKKRVRNDAFDATLFPIEKRINHNEDQPQGIAEYHAPSVNFAEMLSCDDDCSDDSSQDDSHDDHQPRGRPPGVKQVTKPLESRKVHSQAHAHRQNRHDDQHDTNNEDQTAALPYPSSLPVFNHQRGSYVVVSGSSMTTYLPFRGLQSAQPPDSVTLNPRIGMAVEGGKLHLAQTLYRYYRKYIHCPDHGSVDGKPGHHRTVRKVHGTGKLYRAWLCTSQPKGEGHRIDNTDYIELAIAQSD